MDITLWEKYRSCTDPKTKAYLLQQLVTAELPYMRRLIGKFARQSSRKEDIEDLFQAGSIALMKAIERFDPSKGSFSTYAGWYIKDEFQFAIKNATIIQTPKGAGVPYPVHQQVLEFERTHNRLPEPEEVGVSREDWEQWRQWPSTFSMQDKIKGNTHFGVGLQHSIDLPRSAVAQDRRPTQEDMLDQAETDQILHNALGRMDNLSRDILTGLFIRGEAYPVVATKVGLSLHKTKEVASAALSQLRTELAR